MPVFLSNIAKVAADLKILIEKNPDYLNQLESLPEDMRRRWRYGSWDVAVGQYFDEFERSDHVCEPFPIPKEWRRYRAFDYGLDRLACLWIALSPEGDAYVYVQLFEENYPSYSFFLSDKYTIEEIKTLFETLSIK